MFTGWLISTVFSNTLSGAYIIYSHLTILYVYTWPSLSKRDPSVWIKGEKIVQNSRAYEPDTESGLECDTSQIQILITPAQSYAYKLHIT
jgi:hypothetical protein